MKISLIGPGQTGQKVIDLAHDQITAVFDRLSPPTAELLRDSDVSIIFTPGSAAAELIPLVLASQKPAVWGTTGYQWPTDLAQQIIQHQSRWIIAPNFSLSQVIIHQALQALDQLGTMLPSVEFSIEETHHHSKVDQPSGTALEWQKHITLKPPITSIRQGDVFGEHCLKIESDFETIALKHCTKDRKLFAAGALWCAKQLVSMSGEVGLYSLEELVHASIRKE